MNELQRLKSISKVGHSYWSVVTSQAWTISGDHCNNMSGHCNKDASGDLAVCTSQMDRIHLIDIAHQRPALKWDGTCTEEIAAK